MKIRSMITALATKGNVVRINPAFDHLILDIKNAIKHIQGLVITSDDKYCGVTLVGDLLKCD